MHSLYVQYGSAACAPKGWRNFDVSPTLRLQRIPFLGGLFKGQEYLLFPKNVEYGDIIEGLPISQKSCAGIYCSHVLEHLSLRDFRIAIRNTYESLAANGIFRFVLPDLERLARDYLDSDDPRAALLFMERSYLGTPTRSRGMKGLLRRHWGNSAHLWMWDYRAITPELQDVGFRNVRRAEFGDSQDPRFKEVEEAYRWEGCLGVECIR